MVSILVLGLLVALAITTIVVYMDNYLNDDGKTKW